MSQLSKPGILIVEDSLIVSYHLQTTLESEGYTVLGKYDSGEKAIQFAEHNKPDLVLMDVMLTGKLDGIETASILKSKFDVPMIYITSLTDRDTISRAKITQPYGYLVKPFEDRDIFAAIEMALYKHEIESKLRASEEKYFNTVNFISDAVIVINEECRVTYMNPSASSITDWVLEDSIGRPISEVLLIRDEKTHDTYINPVQCAIGNGNVNRMPDDLVLHNRLGKEIPIGESSFSLLINGQDKVNGLILVFKDLTEQHLQEALVRKMELQRKEALIEGQEKERARIARDLHDGLGQMLNAIKMNVNVIVKNPVDAISLSRLLDEAIHESIRISENLLPSKLRDFDLATCVKSLCAQAGTTTQFAINFYQNGILPPMDQSRKINLYRIAQEALHNAIRHSNASVITVQLGTDGTIFRLSVEDNGIGIRNTAILRQNGLMNIKDRAEIIGGKLIMESDQRRGTLIIIEIPLVKS